MEGIPVLDPLEHSGSGDGPGRETFGEDVNFVTVRAFGSGCSPGR